MSRALSLRARLLVGMCLIAVVLGIAATVVVRSIEAHLVAQVDSQLRTVPPASMIHRDVQRMREARQAAGDAPPAPRGWLERDPPPVELDPLYLARVSADGTVTTLDAPSFWGELPSRPEIDGAEALAVAEEDGGPYTVGSDGGERYRVVVQPGPRDGGVDIVALPLTGVDGAIARLMLVEAIAVASVLAVVGLVTWWVIRLGVRPLKQMTVTARNIAGGDLSQRVPGGAEGTETGELGTALNRMLARIQSSFEERLRSERRLRQFAADASHELRTPLATIRGYAELYRSGGLTGEGELNDAMRRTEDEAVRMGTLIDDMLYLVRHDQGRPPARAPVDLAALAEDAVQDASALQSQRPIRATVDGPVTVLGDEGRLRQVVGNLIGNAAVHTPPETPVEVRVQADRQRAVLQVIDQGPGMPAAAVERAFERFYRADPSRSRHKGGAGLGLAIVEATVQEHGGEVTLQSQPDRGTTVRVELPRAANDVPAPGTSTSR